MLAWLLSPLTSILTAIPGLAGKLIDYEVQRQNTAAQTHSTDVAADTQINIAAMQNYLAQQQLLADQRKADSVSPWTAWMLPSLFAVCLYHFSAVVFDSVPSFGHVVGSWKVSVLPNPTMVNIESTVLLTTVGVTLGVPAIRKIFTK